MPPLKDVVWVIQYDKALNLCCYKEDDTGNGRLPGKYCNPTYSLTNVRYVLALGNPKLYLLFTLHPGNK
jgi:hypothetical protein